MNDEKKIEENVENSTSNTTTIDYNKFYELHSQTQTVIHSMDKLAYPITLPEDFNNLKKYVKTIELYANNLCIVSVDITKHPKSISDNKFYPFYSHTFFNIYECDLRENIIRVIVRDIEDKIICGYVINIPTNEPQTRQFLLRNWDNQLALFGLDQGKCGFLKTPYWI